VVGYDWRILTKRLWMNVIAPVAHPYLFFIWNRDSMMRQGAESGARFLYARRVSWLRLV